MTNEQKTMTFGELKAALDKLTPEQLAMPAICWVVEAPQTNIKELWVLDEPHVCMDGEGVEPASAYSAEDLEDQTLIPTGSVFLIADVD